MKTQRIQRWLGMLLSMIVAVGCTQSTERVPITLTKDSASPTTSPPTATESMTPTLTPVATSTPKAIPTLPEDDARNRLLDLLSNNGACHLPCLWGITPGTSNYQDARNILMPLSSISPAINTYFEPAKVNGVLIGTISPFYVDDQYLFGSQIVYLYNDNGIVKNVYFQAVEEEWVTDSNGNWLEKTPIYDSPIFIQRVHYYSLSHLLEEQGMPDSVSILASAQFYNQSGSIEYHIAVFYPNQGIWAHYSAFVSKDLGINIQICPLNMHIEMELYPPGNPDTFITHLEEETDWKALKGGFKPLEEATSMSLEQFYETFRNPTNQQCFVTPANLWPTPDP